MRAETSSHSSTNLPAVAENTTLSVDISVLEMLIPYEVQWLSFDPDLPRINGDRKDDGHCRRDSCARQCQRDESQS